MYFKDYVKQTGRSYESIANQLGVCRATINHIVAGRRRPSLKLCRRIVLIARGAVTADELLDEFGG